MHPAQEQRKEGKRQIKRPVYLVTPLSRLQMECPGLIGGAVLDARSVAPCFFSSGDKGDAGLVNAY